MEKDSSAIPVSGETAKKKCQSECYLLDSKIYPKQIQIMIIEIDTRRFR